MRKCPSIASVYLVSVSHQCIASVPTFETIHPSFFTPHPSDFDGLETAPSSPSDVNVARDVARGVARDVSRGTECMDSLELLIINMIAKDEHVTRTEMAEVAKVSTKTIER